MRKPKFYDLIKFKIIKKKTYTRLYNKSPIKKKTKRYGKNIIHQTRYIVNYNNNS